MQDQYLLLQSHLFQPFGAFKSLYLHRIGAIGNDAILYQITASPQPPD
jgi:hypothetical protein